MKKFNTVDERITYINSLPAEDPTPEELAAIEATESEGYEAFTSLEDFRKELDGCNGKLVLSIPQSLYRRLIMEAAEEGTSLNQYILNKLAQ